MEKSVKQLQEDLGALDARFEALEKEFEGKNPTQEQRDNYQKLIEEREQLIKDLELAKQVEANKAARAAAGTPVQTGFTRDEKDAAKRFSLSKAVQELSRGKELTGVELEMKQEADRELKRDAESVGMRISIPSRFTNITQRTDIDQTTAAIQGTEVGAFVDALRESAVHTQLGATVYNGLTSDFKIPATSKQSVAWATAENSAAADGGANPTKDTLSPVRLTGYVDISNRVQLQNPGVTMAVMRDLGYDVGQKIDKAMLSTSSVSNAPAAIAATSGVLTFTEAGTYAANSSIFSDIVAAEQVLAGGEGLSGRLAYVCATNLMKDLKQSAQVAAVNSAMQVANPDNPSYILNGRRAFFTVAATLSAGTSGDFLFGDWSKVHVGYFGGVDIMVDPYGVAINDQIRLIVHRYVDWSLIQGGAMVKATSLVA